MRNRTKVNKGGSLSLSTTLIAFRVPFTRLWISLDRLIVQDAECDEVNKEMRVLGFNEMVKPRGQGENT